MRIVIDTNRLVAAVISAGLPRQLVNAAKAGVFELCTSEVLLAELLDVMGHTARQHATRRQHTGQRRIKSRLPRPLNHGILRDAAFVSGLWFVVTFAPYASIASTHHDRRTAYPEPNCPA